MTRAVQIAELGDQNVFTIDSSNNRVGIGSTQPTNKLDVNDGAITVGTGITIDSVSGVISATKFVGPMEGTVTGNISGTSAGLSGSPDITITNLTGVAATFTGDVNISGTLTYEDVTNVDSVGFATYRKGINVQGAGSTTTTLNVTGVSTFGGNVSIADSIFHTGDTDTAIRFPAADTFTVETGGTEAFRVASDQKVYFGDFVSAGSKAYIEKEVSGDYKLNIHASSSTSQNREITFNNREDVEALRIDSSSRLLLGTTSSRSTAGTGADLQVETTDAGGRISVVQNRNDANPCPFVVIGKSRGTSIGSNTVLQDDDRIGAIVFAGADGTDMGSDAARIIAEVDGTPGSNDMPGRLILSTTSDGSDSATERLRITSTGGFHFNNAELIERTNIVANKLSAVPNVSLDNGMVHYYTTNETTTANPNIISTAGINTNMATGDTMSVTILSKPNGAGYFPRISIDGLLTGITTYWSGGAAPSAAGASGVDVNVYQIIKTGSETYDVLANTSNFA